VAKSAKTRVIERIFFQRYDPSQGLADEVVTLDQIASAIAEANVEGDQKLSAGNVANFFKDFVRNLTSANANWPSSVFENGYTGRQETGENACFRFMRIADGQTEPFPARIVPAEHVQKVRIESASMPLAARRLGRPDETWLMQVLVRLRVIETHFCLFSATGFQQIDHLQTGVKLGRRSEVDAVYLARAGELDPGSLICCEAKGLRDDILVDQLIRQVRAMFAQDTSPDSMIPVAAKVVGPSLVHIVEFHPVLRDVAADLQVLTIASQAVYEFIPPIPGIGTRSIRSRAVERSADE
jgi:hypothetical protein